MSFDHCRKKPGLGASKEYLLPVRWRHFFGKVQLQLRVQKPSPGQSYCTSEDGEIKQTTVHWFQMNFRRSGGGGERENANAARCGASESMRTPGYGYWVLGVELRQPAGLIGSTLRAHSLASGSALRTIPAVH